jgi:hypothetical protein
MPHTKATKQEKLIHSATEKKQFEMTTHVPKSSPQIQQRKHQTDVTKKSNKVNLWSEAAVCSRVGKVKMCHQNTFNRHEGSSQNVWRSFMIREAKQQTKRGQKTPKALQ